MTDGLIISLDLHSLDAGLINNVLNVVAILADDLSCNQRRKYFFPAKSCST